MAGRLDDHSPLPWIQDACENAAPFTPEREREIRDLAPSLPDEARKALLDVLDELARERADEQDKPTARTAHERRIAELEALVVGLSSEVVRISDNAEALEAIHRQCAIKLRHYENLRRRRRNGG